MSKLLIGFGLVLAFTLGMIIPYTVFDVYGTQEKYQELTRASFNHGFNLGEEFEQCLMLEGRITGRDSCRQQYYKASCETGVSHYLPHCQLDQVKE